jgi:hypothetical protein
MKQSKVVPLALSVLALFYFPALRVAACSCLTTSPCEAFGKAKAVFVGRMIGGSEKVREDKTPEGVSITYEAGWVRFVVEEPFKGVTGEEVTVYVESMKGTSCEGGVIRGERYIVYAGEDKNRLTNGPCSRTHLVADDEDDLSILRGLPEAGTGGRLNVYVDVNVQTANSGVKPLSGINVTVQDSKKVRTVVTTDSNGRFDLSGLRPGKYDVEPVWSPNYAFEPSKVEVTILDRACADVYFEAKIDTRISGRVSDRNGRPVSIPIFLAPVGDQAIERQIQGGSKDDGQFEIAGVAPGRYHLYFALSGDDSKGQKRYFYPGVTKPEEAEVINIGFGEKRDRYDFKMPERFKIRRVEGQVLGPDGRPAAEVQVGFICPHGDSDGYRLDLSPWMVVSDKEGRFVLPGFEGMTYGLQAVSIKAVAGKDPIEMASEMLQLTLREDLTDVKLVLSLPGFLGRGCADKLKGKD